MGWAGGGGKGLVGEKGGGGKKKKKKEFCVLGMCCFYHKFINFFKKKQPQKITHIFKIRMEHKNYLRGMNPLFGEIIITIDDSRKTKTKSRGVRTTTKLNSFKNSTFKFFFVKKKLICTF